MRSNLNTEREKILQAPKEKTSGSNNRTTRQTADFWAVVMEDWQQWSSLGGRHFLSAHNWELRIFPIAKTSNRTLGRRKWVQQEIQGYEEKRRAKKLFCT